MKTSGQIFAGMLATLVTASAAFIAPISGSAMLRSKPSATASAACHLSMTAGSEYTATLPGKPFSDETVFDPLGLSVGAAPRDIKRWREAELKHGRVAMLASIGVLVAESFHPLFMGSKYIGPAIYHFEEITNKFPQFWVAAVTGVAFIEYFQIQRAFAEPDSVTGEGGLKEEYMPGDLGFDPLGLKPQEEETLKTMQTKELNNGRLAMIGIAGMLVQELVKPTDIFS